jgi:hypothetical protein
LFGGNKREKLFPPSGAALTFSAPVIGAEQEKKQKKIKERGYGRRTWRSNGCHGLHVTLRVPGNRVTDQRRSVRHENHER